MSLEDLFKENNKGKRRLVSKQRAVVYISKGEPSSTPSNDSADDYGLCNDTDNFWVKVMWSR